MKTKFKTILLTLTANFSAGTASADYLRFWQGQARNDISQNGFVEGLNQELFPETRALSKTSANLLSYRPIILNKSLTLLGLPEEVALLQYQDEESYKTYRATDEGVAYGDLHWKFFEKTQSKSLIPSTFSRNLQVNNAYQVGSLNSSASVEIFRVYVKNQDVNQEQYLQDFYDHVQYLNQFNPSSLTYIVTETYVLEISRWKNHNDFQQSSISAKTKIGRNGPEDLVMDAFVEHSASLEQNTKLTVQPNLTWGQGFVYKTK